MPFTEIDKDYRAANSSSFTKPSFLPPSATHLLYHSSPASYVAPLAEMESEPFIKLEDFDVIDLDQLPSQLDGPEIVSPSLAQRAFSLNEQSDPSVQDAAVSISESADHQEQRAEDGENNEKSASFVATESTRNSPQNFDYELAISELMGEQGSEDCNLNLRDLAKSIRLVGVRFRSQDPERLQLISSKDVRNIGFLLTGFHSLYENGEIQALKEMNATGIVMMIAQPLNHFPERYRKVADAFWHSFRDCSELEKKVSSKPLPQHSGDQPTIGRKRKSMQTGSGPCNGAQYISRQMEEETTETPKARKKKARKSTDTTSEFQPSPSTPRFGDPPRKIKKTKAIIPDRDTNGAPDDHPIWGLNGIMHHMIGISRPKIDPEYLAIKRSAKAFGHNGLTVGQCWPFQLTVLRDGGHGSSQGGICGDIENGAYSVIVGSKMYSDVDEDSTDGILYSAPLGNDTENEKPDKENKGTRSLYKSIRTKRPIRVFRKAEGKNKDAPRMGLRYDGLYQAVKAVERTNSRGGKYASFLLTRLEGQDPIDTKKPTAAQVAEFLRIKDGY